MARQLCRTDNCDGGFDYQSTDLRIGTEKSCTTCETVHVFDGFRWAILDEDTVIPN